MKVESDMDGGDLDARSSKFCTFSMDMLETGDMYRVRVGSMDSNSASHA